MPVLGCRGCGAPASLTSPRGRQERLRTDAGSRKAPARRTKPQAESGGRGAWSQHQACPDGVGVSLPKSLAPVISTTVPPACPWAALSTEGPSGPEQKPAASGGCVPAGAAFLCRCCRGTVCVCVSPILSCLSGPHSLCVFPSFCRFVCACPCAWVRSDECARTNAPGAPKGDFLRVGLALPSLFLLPLCLGLAAGSSVVSAAVPLGVPEGHDRVRRCVFPSSSGEISLPLPIGRPPGIKITTVQPGTKAPEELIALQERSRPASEERLVPFHGASLRNEVAPRQKLEEEAGKGRCQASRSLERWPLWTRQPLGNPPLRSAAVAAGSIRPGLRPLLCPASCSVSPVSRGPTRFSVWLNVWDTDRFPVRQGDTPRTSVR